ncbi:MAG: hypothetical protein CFK48_07530 [Armatimonadetes bacterium CP1_7O]|nr:MAG: hypothetical protein CFK48_07530 [Armatimonadetes bacterium CP1_7O]
MVTVRADARIDSRRYMMRSLSYLMAQAYLHGFDWRDALVQLEREFYGGRVPSYEPLPLLLGPTAADRLREARLVRGVRQVDLMRPPLTTAENISRYESGARDFMRARIRTLLAMARGLRCSILDFVDKVMGM